MPISEEELRDRVLTMRRSVRNGVYAPHKPLLLLWALGRIQANESRLVLYTDAEQPLRELLEEFGPNEPTSPRYPFWHSRTDGLWEVVGADHLPKDKAGRRPTEETMRSLGEGGFPVEIDSLLRSNPHLAGQLALDLLTYFSDTLAPEIAEACGLDLNNGLEAKRKRQAGFSEAVLTAYESSCAVCGWDVRVGSRRVGLDAAHVWAWSKGGTDEVANGVALCRSHHVAYDKGLMSFGSERTVLISQHGTGGDGFSEQFLRWRNQPLRAPQAGYPAVDLARAEQHRNQIFRGPPRA